MKCPYPGCKTSVLDGIVSMNGDERVGEEYCLEHQTITCRWPLYEPLCQERPTPRSVYCREHDELASFVKIFHAALHQEAAARQQEIVRNQQIERQVRRDLFGQKELGQWRD